MSVEGIHIKLYETPRFGECPIEANGFTKYLIDSNRRDICSVMQNIWH